MKTFITDNLFEIIIIIIIIICIIFAISISNSNYSCRDITYIESNANNYLTELGFKDIKHISTTADVIYGGISTYLVKDSYNLLYTVEIIEWDGSLEIYSINCLNAISSK